MLKTLDIQNVALIDNLSLDFSKKFTVLSGETGAGKSIIIDSLNFVLGGKTSRTLIKQGQDFMKVSACFSSPFSNEVKNVLKSFDIDFDDEIIITRKMNTEGKGDIRVNGSVLNANMLKNIATLLVDIHGQHEHQRLLKDKFHIEIIDSFIKDRSIFSPYSAKLNVLKEINSQIQKLNGSSENQERMLDLLDYQIKEIENAKLQEKEDEILEQKKFLMVNSEKIFDGLKDSLENLDGSSSIVDNIKKTNSSLNSITKFDDSLSSYVERLDGIKYEVLDIIDSLKEKKDACNFDEYEFEKIDERLDKIKILKKKYGPTLEDVLVFLKKSQNDYDNILNSKEKLKEKLKEKDEVLCELFSLSKNISKVRRDIAKNFEDKTKIELNDLGMKNARFKVEFNEITKDDFESKLNSNGCDKIRFMFSANAGQDMQPLSEIISGGEASRFMLALKNILAENDDINLMVFDEIDTGISGEMGYKVACKLANISKKHQVISVSHLPQICAMADHNIKVLKFVENDKTKVSAQTLSKADALEEISRLSGGSQNSDVSLLHARALKSRCDEFKKSL